MSQDRALVAGRLQANHRRGAGNERESQGSKSKTHIALKSRKTCDPHSRFFFFFLFPSSSPPSSSLPFLPFFTFPCEALPLISSLPPPRSSYTYFLLDQVELVLDRGHLCVLSASSFPLLSFIPQPRRLGLF